MSILDQAETGSAPRAVSTAMTVLFLLVPAAAWAIVSGGDMPNPPSYPGAPCSASSAQVTPSLKNRTYRFQGVCWINTADDKYDMDHPAWVNAPTVVDGSYDFNSHAMKESVTINGPSGPISIQTIGDCDDDPWEKAIVCTGISPPNTFQAGWPAIGGGLRGPMSRLVIDTSFIQGLLAKQESKPPRPPVNVDPVVWPVDSGKSTRVTVKWNAGDMSGGRWVMQFDVQTSRQKTDSDSAYSKAGQVLGLGPKQSFSSGDLSRVYVFTLPSEVKPVESYFFRVCAINDADTQCTAPAQARKPTKQEQMALAGQTHIVSGGLAPASGAKSPATSGAKPSGPIALGTARPGVSQGGAPAGGGSTGIGLARSGAPTALGAARPGGAAGGGGTPGAVAIPDLAVGRGMIVRDQTIAWGNATNLTLRADATRECALPVSFEYENVGKGPAGNVTAEISDSLHPAQPIATQTLASMTASQSSTVRGVLKVGVQVQPRQVVVVAKVHESGQIHETNMTNDRGSITLNVTCRPK